MWISRIVQEANYTKTIINKHSMFELWSGIYKTLKTTVSDVHMYTYTLYVYFIATKT